MPHYDVLNLGQISLPSRTQFRCPCNNAAIPHAVALPEYLGLRVPTQVQTSTVPRLPHCAMKKNINGLKHRLEQHNNRTATLADRLVFCSNKAHPHVQSLRPSAVSFAACYRTSIKSRNIETCQPTCTLRHILACLECQKKPLSNLPLVNSSLLYISVLNSK
jgi:hypothetical protein